MFCKIYVDQIAFKALLNNNSLITIIICLNDSPNYLSSVYDETFDYSDMELEDVLFNYGCSNFKLEPKKGRWQNIKKTNQLVKFENETNITNI